MGLLASRLPTVPAALLVILLGAGPGASLLGQARAAPAEPPEPVLKAQFFERFTRFVQWPQASPTPFVICLVGGNRLADEIDRLAARRAFKQPTTQVRRLGLHPAIDPQGCHALYIDEGARPFLAALVARTRGLPILTVADTPGFCQRGVLINMYLEDGFVRFEVNGPAARATRLRLSSQLLRLARIIEEPAGP